MAGKSLNPDQNKRLRSLLREIVERDFAGNKTHAARRLKISQSMVSEVLVGRRGGGNKLLASLADYTGKSLDELSGRPPPRAVLPELTLELPLRYEAQAEAERFAMANKHPPLLVHRAATELHDEGRHGAEEWTAQDWYEEILRKMREILRREHSPEAVRAEEERGEKRLDEIAASLQARSKAALERGPRKRGE